jgi:hypothetical protein
MDILIPTRKVTYTSEQYDRWKNGDRDDCMDSYCRNLPGTLGFGEYIGGKYFETLGYEWIHHDFNLLGGNKLGKYPKAEGIFRQYFGDERYEKGRQLYYLFSPSVRIEGPDLLVFKPNASEIRFAECKRNDTRDKLRDSQVRGLALLKLLFGCHVEVIEIIEEGKGENGEGKPIKWSF